MVAATSYWPRLRAIYTRAIVVETPLSRLQTLRQLVPNGDSTQHKVTQICAGQNKPLMVGRRLPPSPRVHCTIAAHISMAWAPDAGAPAGSIFGAIEQQVVRYVG